MNYPLALLEQKIKNQRKRLAQACCDESKGAGLILRDDLDELYKRRLVMEDDHTVINFFERKEG